MSVASRARVLSDGQTNWIKSIPFVCLSQVHGGWFIICSTRHACEYFFCTDHGRRRRRRCSSAASPACLFTSSHIIQHLYQINLTNNQSCHQLYRHHLITSAPTPLHSPTTKTAAALLPLLILPALMLMAMHPYYSPRHARNALHLPTMPPVHLEMCSPIRNH